MFLKEDNCRRKLDWDETAATSFVAVKDTLSEKMLLLYPTLGAPITLIVNALEKGSGAVVQQEVDGEQQPLMFFFQTFNEAQCRYSTFDRELLAMFFAVRYFSWLLETRPFTILTDHRPLVSAFKAPMSQASPRQTRHLSTIAEYTTGVK